MLSQVEEYGNVVVKMDTGMSRNGCQPEELDSIMDVSKAPNRKKCGYGSLVGRVLEVKNVLTRFPHFSVH